MKKTIFLLAFFCLLPTAYARDYWAAIYLNETTGIAGYSIDQDKKVTAGRLARDDCRRKNKGKAGECKKMANFGNQCGAVAWSAKNRAGRGGVAQSNMADVEQAALKRCSIMEKDPDCKVVAALCTSWEVWTTETIWWYF